MNLVFVHLDCESLWVTNVGKSGQKSSLICVPAISEWLLGVKCQARGSTRKGVS